MKREVNTHNIFVLTDDENRIVAVIETSLDIEALKAKICLAISEDTNYENVEISNVFEFDEDTYSLEFEVMYDDEDTEENIGTWYLEKTALY